MKCECDLCIHNQDGFCHAENVYIDSHGACSECILVQIPNTELSRHKSSQRDSMAE